MSIEILTSIAAKVVIWALFFSSLVGVFLSIVLWRRSTRRAIASLLSVATNNLERPDQEQSTDLLFGGIIGTLLLNERGAVSVRKTALVALASTGLAGAALASIQMQTASITARDLGVPIPIFLTHWLIEYLVARVFVRRLYLFAHESLYQAAFMAGVRVVAIVFTVPILIVLLQLLIGGIMVFAGLQPEALPFLAYVYVGTILNGFYLAVIAVALFLADAGSTPIPLTAVILFTLSTCAILVAVLALLLVVSLFRFRSVLGVVQHSCEVIEKLKPSVVFWSSLGLLGAAGSLIEVFNFWRQS